MSSIFLPVSKQEACNEYISRKGAFAALGRCAKCNFRESEHHKVKPVITLKRQNSPFGSNELNVNKDEVHILEEPLEVKPTISPTRAASGSFFGALSGLVSTVTTTLGLDAQEVVENNETKETTTGSTLRRTSSKEEGTRKSRGSSIFDSRPASSKGGDEQRHSSDSISIPTTTTTGRRNAKIGMNRRRSTKATDEQQYHLSFSLDDDFLEADNPLFLSTLNQMDSVEEETHLDPLSTKTEEDTRKNEQEKEEVPIVESALTPPVSIPFQKSETQERKVTFNNIVIQENEISSLSASVEEERKSMEEEEKSAEGFRKASVIARINQIEKKQPSTPSRFVESKPKPVTPVKIEQKLESNIMEKAAEHETKKDEEKSIGVQFEEELKSDEKVGGKQEKEILEDEKLIGVFVEESKKDDSTEPDKRETSDPDSSSSPMRRKSSSWIKYPPVTRKSRSSSTASDATDSSIKRPSSIRMFAGQIKETMRKASITWETRIGDSIPNCNRCGRPIEHHHKVVTAGMQKFHEICPKKEESEKGIRNCRYMIQKAQERIVMTFMIDKDTRHPYTFIFDLDPNSRFEMLKKNNTDDMRLVYVADVNQHSGLERTFIKPNNIQFDIGVRYARLFTFTNPVTNEEVSPIYDKANKTVTVTKYCEGNGINHAVEAKFVFDEVERVLSPIHLELRYSMMPGVVKPRQRLPTVVKKNKLVSNTITRATTVGT